MAKDIYFACSISSGQGDAELYEELIEHIKTHGTVIGDTKLALLGQGNTGTNETVYAREMDWVRRADILIAEVTTPSLGVGYEIAKAEDSGKPVLALFRDASGNRLSAMIGGSPYSSMVTYETVEDAKTAIDGFLRAFGSLSSVAD